MRNGVACGSILYESKNSTRWRDEWVSKLNRDQTAVEANHAILSTFKFKTDKAQVDVRDGVIIVNPAKDLRKLRAILPDPVAREHFLSKQGDIDSAMLRLGPPQKKDKSGLAADLESAIESMKRVPWTALSDLKGDPEILKKIDDAEALLKSLRRALES